MNLSRFILRKLRTEHIGRSRAIKRKDLLEYLYGQGAKIDDREMRAIIESLPIICSCAEGYFIADKYEDVQHSIEYIKKKAISLMAKIRKKKEVYPQFYGEDPPQEPVQGDLF